MIVAKMMTKLNSSENYYFQPKIFYFKVKGILLIFNQILAERHFIYGHLIYRDFYHVFVASLSVTVVVIVMKVYDDNLRMVIIS